MMNHRAHRKAERMTNAQALMTKEAPMSKCFNMLILVLRSRSLERADSVGLWSLVISPVIR